MVAARRASLSSDNSYSPQLLNRSQYLSSSCFSARLKIEDGHPSLWFADEFLTSYLQPLKRIWRNLTESKNSTSSVYIIYVFRTDRKSSMAALASDRLIYFQLLLCNHWTEFNETWQEVTREMISTSPSQFVPFAGADRKTKTTWPLIDWDFCICNRWTEFYETLT